MYLVQVKFTARSGQRDELASILIQASKLVSTANGCKIYVVGKEPNDNHSVYVTEIWVTKEDHDDSLKMPGVRELIAQAMPIIDGQPRKIHELEIVGGIGI